jgi:hypothetical protein
MADYFSADHSAVSRRQTTIIELGLPADNSKIFRQINLYYTRTNRTFLPAEIAVAFER